MLRSRPWLCAGLLFATVAGCSETASEPERDAGQPDAAAPDAGRPFRLAALTFNMALTTTVKGPEERLPAIVAALIDADADVLCLQEAFSPVAPPARVAEALSAHYPHAFASNLPDQTAFGAGLLIVSKHALEASTALRFAEEDPFGVVDRSVLVSDLTVSGQPVRVACAHLNPLLSAEGIASRGAQVDELFAFLDQQPAHDGPLLLLGDFNAGPDPIGTCGPTTTPACDSPDTTTYDKVLTRFDDTGAELAACTQCKAQFDAMQVSGLFSDEPDQRIDHCFVASLAPHVHLETQIVLDEQVAIPFGEETLAHLSDHRGVRCTFGAASP
jgi:endonuclease/exonuclease/phosphatase family metal-dependent hydrolase